MKDRVTLKVGANAFHGEICESPPVFLATQNEGHAKVTFLAIKLDNPAFFPDGHETSVEVFYKRKWSSGTVEAPPNIPSHKVVFITTKDEETQHE
jgi:hypothetical protein